MDTSTLWKVERPRSLFGSVKGDLPMRILFDIGIVTVLIATIWLGHPTVPLF